MDRIRENEARLPEHLRERLAAEAAGGDELAEGDRTNIDSDDVSRWGQEGNREHQGSRQRSKGMGFVEGALECRCPGNPVQDLPGASSIPTMMLQWGKGHGGPSTRPASGPGFFRDKSTVLPDAEPLQSPPGPGHLPAGLASALTLLPYGLRTADAPLTVWRVPEMAPSWSLQPKTTSSRSAASHGMS